MTNLTLSIDEPVLRRARIRALEEGTSVNALVREHLARYAAGERRLPDMTWFLELSRASAASSGPGG
ncbi:MAG: hypothetical protein LBS27_10455, partial [Bifidobacteriaceae bacterium]|nr:hypothetical protein [Bifidobacteriaceae bacterium]